MDSEFFAGGDWAQIFLVMLNLRSKIIQNFFIYRVLWMLNFSRGEARHQLFFGHAKFEVKKFQYFLIYRALWTLIFRQWGSGQ